MRTIKFYLSTSYIARTFIKTNLLWMLWLCYFTLWCMLVSVRTDFFFKKSLLDLFGFILQKKFRVKWSTIIISPYKTVWQTLITSTVLKKNFCRMSIEFYPRSKSMLSLNEPHVKYCIIICMYIFLSIQLFCFSDSDFKKMFYHKILFSNHKISRLSKVFSIEH